MVRCPSLNSVLPAVILCLFVYSALIPPIAESSSLNDNVLRDQVQYNTFLKWVNIHLERAGHAILHDLDGSFSDGWALARLTNALFDVPIPKLINSPRLKAFKLDNIHQVFKMLEAAGVKISLLQPHHLVDDEYRTMRLGMVWILILDYTIKGISVDDLTEKDGLLQWCQKNTAGYDKIYSLNNFSNDWKSGLAFCALIHRHHPELLSYEDALARNNAAENLEIAFSVAEKHLDIARLIDVEDILDSPKPDERSIMTYVSQYFHRFTIDDVRKSALDRISGFISLARQVSGRCDAYERRTEALLEWIDEKLVKFAIRDFGVTLEETKQVWKDLRLLVLEEKPTQSAEKMDLENEFMEIISFQNRNNLAAFEPKETLTVDYVQARFEDLATAQTAYEEAIRVARASFQQGESLENEFIFAFENFDTDNTGTLNRAEFKAACRSLGVAFDNNDAFEELFERVSLTEDSERVVSKKAFTSFLAELYDGTPDAMKSAFEQLAGNSQNISKTQLQKSGLSTDDLMFLFNHLVTDEDSESLPFNHLISSTFA